MENIQGQKSTLLLFKDHVDQTEGLLVRKF